MVIMENPEISTLETAPKNRAQAWFRVALWILPTGFVVASAVGLGWVHEKLFPFDSIVAVWFLLNLALVIAAGWFTAVLSIRSPDERVIHGIFAFIVYQLFLIPALLGLFLFLINLINPIQF